MAKTKFVIDSNDASLFQISQSANRSTPVGKPMLWGDGTKNGVTGTKMIEATPQHITYLWELGSSVHIIVETRTRKYSTIIPKQDLLRALKS